MTEKQTENTDLQNEIKEGLEAANRVYKNGYLDGMIAGLHAAKCSSEEISKYIGCNEEYVKEEIKAFLETCGNEKGKIKEHIPIYCPKALAKKLDDYSMYVEFKAFKDKETFIKENELEGCIYNDATFLLVIEDDNYDGKPLRENNRNHIYHVDIGWCKLNGESTYMDDTWITENDWNEGQKLTVLGYIPISDLGQ